MTQAATMTDPDRIRELVQARVDQEQTGRAAQDEPRGQGGRFSEQEIMDALRQNEDGDAALFIRLHQGRLLYDHSAGRWFTWEGHYWTLDILDQATAAVGAVVDVFREEAQRQSWQKYKAEKAGTSDKAKSHAAREDALLRRARDLCTARRKQAILSLARAGKDSLGDPGQAWDGNPWLLACPNGVVDLKTGTLRPGRPGDMIRTPCPTEYRGFDESAPVWESFLTSVFDGDQDLVGFVQRLFGYAIAGEIKEHVLPILWGAGANGKSTLLEAVFHVLGPLAGPIQSEMLLAQNQTRSSAGPSPDIMALQGKRIVSASETDEGRKLSVARVKALTGGDTIVGRMPYGRHEVAFKPQHTIFLCTNHKPRADADDFALWRRVLLIPFTRAFVPDPQEKHQRPVDKDLPEKLRAEASGILAWLIRGCLDWQDKGLGPPESVKAATSEYQSGEDLIGQFFGECCLIQTNTEVKAGYLYEAYRQWCGENGHRYISGTKFGKRVKDRFDSYQNYKGVFYLGIGLIDQNRGES
ncbi:MAG: DNA primase [Desulfatibacillum sp.]|nr:DNA primase [Desulfatibacillum sp.]